VTTTSSILGEETGHRCQLGSLHRPAKDNNATKLGTHWRRSPSAAAAI
jgi:hypothetical protein